MNTSATEYVVRIWPDGLTGFELQRRINRACVRENASLHSISFKPPTPSVEGYIYVVLEKTPPAGSDESGMGQGGYGDGPYGDEGETRE